MTAPRSLLLLLTVAAALSSCRKAEVTAYRIPKEETPQMPPANAPTPGPMAAGGGSMANTAVNTATGADLTWTAPAHWTAKPASAMRKGSYTIKADGASGAEADLSITAFPGDVGGELANVNRWRGQEGIQLPPLAQADLASATQHLDRNGLHMTFVEMAGTGANAKRTIGAIVPYEGATWFFKLMGPDALVAKEKGAFTAFLDTIKPAAK